MTEQDLLAWGLEYYFLDWETEAAKALLDKQGMDSAVEYLKRRTSEGIRGSCGPGQPSFNTGGGKVMLYQSGFGEPDYVVAIEKFCRWKLESLYQVKML